MTNIIRFSISLINHGEACHQANSSMPQTRVAKPKQSTCYIEWSQRSLSLGWIVLAMIVATVFNSICIAQDDTDPDNLDRDYATELPRIPPTSPQAALKTFRVAPGFRMELVAAEPLVVDPVAMAFDENGRLYVVEMRGYSEDGEQNLGRIRLLDDIDGDGIFDKSKIFVSGLSWPTAVTCYAGGIFVGAAPKITYFKDTDGDDQADLQEVVYQGFSRNNVQGLLNSFKWGLDNRIHGATGTSGGHVQRMEEKNGTESSLTVDGNQDRIELRGRDFAFDPRSMSLTATSGGAQHGMSFNRWGEKFVCSNSNHIQHVLFEDRYLARNPYFAAPGSRRNIAADGEQADVFRLSPIEPWRIVRTRLRVKGLIPGPVEGGGTAAGYFTSATGITIYRGNAWPRKYVGWAILGDVGSNLVHRKQLTTQGVSYIANRVDEKSEFIVSNDIWFRPVQYANAPDGTLYVADMYREVIEHPLSLAPVIKKHLDLTSGRNRGRIYRIVPSKFRQPKRIRMGDANADKLATLLTHDNGWHRETAARILYQRQDRKVIPQVEKIARTAELPESRIRALHVLDGLGGVSKQILFDALTDSHARVRQHAVQLCESLVNDEPQIQARLFDMVADKDLRVRYQLAFSIGQIASGPQRNQAIAALAADPTDNEFIRIAVFSSLKAGAGEVLAQLAQNASFLTSPGGRDWITSLTAQIGKQQNGQDIAAVLTVLGKLADSDPETTKVVIQGLAAKPGSKLENQVSIATGGQSQEFMKQLLKNAVVVARNSSAEIDSRVEAVHLLRLGKLEDFSTVFSELLAVTQPVHLQTAVLSTLATFVSPRVAVLLTKRWKTFSPRIRARAADVLFSREVWLPTLLDSMSSGNITPSDIGSSRLQLLANHHDQQIRERAAKLLASLNIGRRADILKDYQVTLKLSGDPANGKKVFKKVCAGCHQVEGVGHTIGPNLAAMRNRGPESILTNVLAPNRETNPQFLNYQAITIDGRTFTGMIVAETATSVTLKREENKSQTVLRIDIDELRSTGVSLMPEGLEKHIDPQSMADLIAYLLTVR